MKKQRAILVAGIAALSALSAGADAASISRLNPPSALFTFGDAGAPYISRFLPGQRFDLNCTVQPDAGRTVTSVVFKVDGGIVTGTVPLTTTGLVAGLATNSAVATRTPIPRPFRAFTR